MTRIASFVQQQTLLAELQKAGVRSNSEQLKISTGKNAQVYKDIPESIGVLMSAKRVATGVETYQSTNTELANTLNLQDTTLSQVASTAQDLRQSLLDTTSLGSGQTVMQQAQSAFTQALAALNTQVNGVYMFGGTRTDQAPVTATQLSDLQLVPSAASVFANNQGRVGIEVDQGQTVQYNFLADQVGKDLMDSLKRIADFNAGPNGPFSPTLTEPQRAFLQTESQNLKTITENLNQVVGQNGQLQNIVDEADTRLSQKLTQTKSFISDIEDADVAKAVSNLNQDQLVMQASSKLIASLRDNSLLNYI